MKPHEPENVEGVAQAPMSGDVDCQKYALNNDRGVGSGRTRVLGVNAADVTAPQPVVGCGRTSRETFRTLNKGYVRTRGM